MSAATPEALAEARREMARQGGAAGRGDAKRRGDSSHYRAMSRARGGIVARNDFHGTEVRLIPRDGWLSQASVRRARSILCGASGCTCGGAIGQRGDQDWQIVDQRADGTVRVEVVR